jgi:hypothetical protein
VALRILRRYLAALEFRRPGEKCADGSRGESIPFKIPTRNIHIGWPDYEVDLEANFPSLVFLHQTAEYVSLGLNSYVQEETRDRYAPGTVVQWQSEYQEEVIVEIWANKRAELRSLLAGIEVALSPTEPMYGIRFRMPDYFDQLVCFAPVSRQEFDEQDSARNRRRARLIVEMRFTIVALVNIGFPLINVVKSTFDVDPDYNTPVDDEELDPKPPSHEGSCDPCG